MVKKQEKPKKFMCPVCGEATEVFDTYGKGDSTRRRRKCQKCHYKFDTLEIDIDLLQKQSIIDGEPLTLKEIEALRLLRKVPPKHINAILEIIRIATNST